MRHDSDDVHANPPAGNLAQLRNLPDFKVAEGAPDVRGWPVHASDGHRIGDVHDLLVDISAMTVRYLDVEIDLDFVQGSPESRQARQQETNPGGEAPAESPTLNEDGTAAFGPHATVTEHLVRGSLSEEENRLSGGPLADEEVRPHGGRRHVLIPIGRARLGREVDRVFVDGFVSEAVLELPEYEHGLVSREFEAEVLQRFDRGYVHSPERDFYSHSLYDQDSFYSARRERTGEKVAGQPLEVPVEIDLRGL